MSFANGWYKVRENKLTRIPGRWICLDVETYESPINAKGGGEIHTFRLAATTFTRFVNGVPKTEDYAVHYSTKSIWDFVKSHTDKRSKLYLFAHNLGFDLTAGDLWKECNNDGLKIERFIISDPPTIVWLDWAGRKIVCADTLNFMRCGLKEIGRNIGIEKMPMPHQSEGNDKWEEYCLNDARILTRFVNVWISTVKRLDLGNFSATVAGQAWQAFRHRALSDELVIHGNAEAKAAERLSYYGGRVLVGRVGEINEKIYHLDVNSLYTHMMRDRNYPICLIHSAFRSDPESLLTVMQNCEATAGVSFDSALHEYPLKIGNRIQYARGKFDCYLCGDELRRALGGESVVRVSNVYIYRSAKLFQKWCDIWIPLIEEEKRAGRRITSAIYKAIANSLTGKFAQRDISSRLLKCFDPPCQFGHWSVYDQVKQIEYECQTIAGTTVGIFKGQSSPNSFPLISACITANARVYMDWLRSNALTRNVFYQDTDSLMVTADGMNRLSCAGLISDYEVGKLKIVDEYNWIKIDGHRRYWTPRGRKISGIKPSSDTVSHGVYMQDTFQGLKSMISTDPMGRVRVANRTLTLSPAWIDGVVSTDGYVKPMVID